MDRKSFGNLVKGIETKMLHAYCSNHTRVFWPEQFAEDATGASATTEDVLRAFRSLAEVGKIDIIVDALCQDGHRIWSGPPEEFKTLEYCSRCADPNDVELHTQLRAELDMEWASDLCGDQKKTPAKRG